MAEQRDTVLVQGCSKVGEAGKGPGRYGQDFVLHAAFPGIVILILCDGHGAAGHHYAEQGAKAFLTLLKAHLYMVQNHFATIGEAESQNEMTQWLQKLFLRIEKHLYDALHCRGIKGGTTVTVTLIVEKRFIITANLGDSPAMLILKDGSYVMLTNAHSADDLEEYCKYQLYCRNHGKTPGRAVYGRIQVKGADQVADYIPIFVEDADGKWQVSEGNMQLLHKLAGPEKVGGVQTVRKDRNHGHLNWGSTIEGTVQNLRGWGDFDHKEQGFMIGNAHPSIAFYVAPKNFAILLASDGVTDTHWFEHVAEHFGDGLRTVQDPEVVMDSFMRKTIDSGKKAGFPVDKTTGKPAWDDMSACSFTSMQFNAKTAPVACNASRVLHRVQQAARRSESREGRKTRPY